MATVDVGGHPVRGERRGGVEGQLQRGLVDRVELGQVALTRAGLVRWGHGHLLRQHELLPPPDDVLGGPRLAIGPLQALAEPERPLRRVVVGLPGLHETGDDVLAVVQEAQRGVAVEELPVGVGRGRAGGGEDVHVDGAAVLSRLNPAVRDDVRAVGQPLLDRRQVLTVQRRCLLELRRLGHDAGSAPPPRAVAPFAGAPPPPHLAAVGPPVLAVLHRSSASRYPTPYTVST